MERDVRLRKRFESRPELPSERLSQYVHVDFYAGEEFPGSDFDVSKAPLGEKYEVHLL